MGQLEAVQGVDRFYNPPFQNDSPVSFDVAVVLQCTGDCQVHFAFGNTSMFIRYHTVDSFLLQLFLIDDFNCFHSFAALLLGDF